MDTRIGTCSWRECADRFIALQEYSVAHQNSLWNAAKWTQSHGALYTALERSKDDGLVLPSGNY